MRGGSICETASIVVVAGTGLGGEVGVMGLADGSTAAAAAATAAAAAAALATVEGRVQLRADSRSLSREAVGDALQRGVGAEERVSMRSDGFYETGWGGRTQSMGFVSCQQSQK